MSGKAWRRKLARLLRSLRRVLAVLLAALGLAAAAAVLALTQTERGRGVLAATLQDALQGAVAAGEVRLGRITGGNLITGAELERFEIVGPDGELFLRVEGVTLEYDPRGFAAQDFSFRRLDADRMTLRLLQEAGDGSWNFDRIFGGGEEEPVDTGGLRLLFRDVTLRDGRVEVRTPWEAGPGGGGGPGEGAAAAVWRIEPSASGERMERVLEVDALRAALPLLRIVDPQQPMALEIQGLSGIAAVVRQPLDVLSFDGGATFGDTIHIRVDRAQLPHSELSGAGWVVAEDPPPFRFDLEARPAGFADLQWLPVPVPEVGGGPMDLVLASAGEALRLEVSEARVEVEDTRTDGGFTLTLAEAPRFEAMDLRFHPLRLRLADRLLERPEGPDGFLEGTLRGDGPLDALRIDARAALTGLGGDGEPSRFEARGRIGVVPPHALRELELQLDGFEPRWVGLLGLSSPVDGRLTGTLVLDGAGDTGRLSVRGELQHVRPGGQLSRAEGEGTVTYPGVEEVDVRLTVDPLALSLLDPHVRGLNLVGAVRGPLEARGSLDDLLARAELETPRGRLSFDGRFDLEATRRAYDAEVVASGIDLRQWADAWPETELALRGRVEGTGTDPADLEASFDLEILPSRFDRARVDTSTLRFTLAEGLATVDTLDVRTDVGTAAGHGGFGLAEGRSGALVLDVDVPDLAAWNRWLREDYTASGGVADPRDLFAQVVPPEEAGPRADAAAPDTLEGRLAGRGAVYGNVERFSFGGRLAGGGVAYGPYRTDSLLATLDIPDPTHPDSLLANLTAWGPEVLGRRADSMALRFDRRGPTSGSARLYVVRDTTAELTAEGALSWEAGRRSLELDALRLGMGEHEVALARPAVAVYGEAGLRVDDFELVGPQGESIRLRGEVPSEGEATLDLAFEDLHLAELLRLAPGAPEVGGSLDGSLAVRGTAGAPRMDASLRLREATFGEAIYPLLHAEGRYEDRRVTGEAALEGEAGTLVSVRGDVRADLSFREVERRLLEDALDLRVVADSLPARILGPAVPSLVDLEGRLRLDVGVRGSPGELAFDGEARLEDGAARVPDLGVRYAGVRGRVVFDGSRARIDSLLVPSVGGGRARVTGSVDLAEARDPGFDLTVRAERLRAMDRRAMGFLLGGEGHLTGSYREPRLTGRFRILNGDVRQDEFLRAQSVIDLTDPDVYTLIDTTAVAERRLLARVRNPFMQNLQLEANLDVGPDLWLRSDVLDVEVAGEGLDVRMDRAAQSLVVFGTVRLLRGTYRFDRLKPYSQQLRITGGTIEFVGTPGLNPSVDITAEYRTRTPQGPVTVVAVIGGTMRESTLTLTSDPPLSESDQLCFLAVGSPCFAAVDQRLGSRLVRESVLGTIGSQLSTALVGDVGLDYLSLRSAGYGAELAEGEEGAGFFSQGLFANAEVEFGKYMGNDLFLTVTQPLGNRFPGVAVEWRFSDSWTMEARTENRFGRLFNLVGASSLEFDRTYGLFLFREWSF